MRNATVNEVLLPVEAGELRRMVATRRNQHSAARCGRDQVTRILMLVDAELVAMAAAINASMRDGLNVSQITRRLVERGATRRIDEAVVLSFLRAVGLEHRVKRRGGFAAYHARKALETAQLGTSAYTNRRGPARLGIEDLPEIDDDEADALDYIRGQGAF